MNTIKMINEYVNKHNMYGSKILELDHYIKINQNVAPHLSGNSRSLQDLVTLTAWTTSQEVLQRILYLSMDESIQHAVKIHYTSGCLCQKHTHNYIELTYIIEGRMVQMIEGKTIEYKQGEICLVNTNTVHSEYLYADNASVICLGLDDIFFSKYDNLEKTSDYTLNLKKLINKKRGEYLYIKFSPIKNDITQTSHAFSIILEEMMHSLPGKKRLIIGYIERIIDLLTKEYHFSITNTDKKELHLALIQDICKYIELHFSTINVQKISQFYNYSPDYLSKLFMNYYGMNLSSYIQSIRMSHAFSLLRTTNFTIEEISHQVGYHNIGFFYKKFKEKYQESPDIIRHLIE